MNLVKPQMRVFVDCEGIPLQELGAICVDWDTLQIYSVFLNYCMCPLPETQSCAFSRRHIHGLNIDFLQQCHPTSDELITDFYRWIDHLPSDFEYLFFANDPSMEKKLFPLLRFYDVCLPPWLDRVHLRSHKLAYDAKQYDAPLLDKQCVASTVHSAYNPFPHRRHTATPSQLAMLESGHHCALYDTFECYLYQVFKRLND